MDKIKLTSAIGIASVLFTANASIDMCIEKTDGTIIRYDVDKVKQVYYEEVVSDTSFDQGVTVSGKVGDYTYVDLGLKSGIKWATYNVGATKPTEYGDYFAWGETKPKDNYKWETYKWCNGSSSSLIKYTTAKDYASSIDYKTILETTDDVATTSWGEGWRMPTKSEQDELRAGCTWEWTEDFNGTGIAGQIGTSTTNGNTIFLPASGSYIGINLVNNGKNGSYWSSTRFDDDDISAWSLLVNNLTTFWGGSNRCNGNSVRAVVK